MVSNQGKITTLAADANVDKGLVDGTDKLHSGIIKVLESFAQGDMCISHAGFTITDGGDYTQYNLAQPIKFYKKGEFVSHTVTLTEAYTSTVQDATHSRYDWVLINPATPELVIVQGTAGTTPLVSDITAGYIPIALVHITAGSDNDKFDYSFQTYTMNVAKNSLSIGYDNSGYTEAMSIVATADRTTFKNKVANADIRFILADNTADEKFEILSDDDSDGDEGDTEIFSVDGTGVTSVKSLSLGTAGELTITESSDDITIKNTVSDKDIIFNVLDGSTDTEVMRIDGATSQIRVGVCSASATDGPDAKLDIRGSNDNTVSVRASGTLSVENSAEATSPSSRAYAFLSVDNSDAMVGGNIRLDDSVSGGTHDGYASGTNLRGGAGIVFTNTSSSNDGEIKFVRQNDSDDDTWTVKESMRINNAGNVGIGTTNPSNKLEVTGNTVSTNVTATSALTGDTATATTALTTNGLMFKRGEAFSATVGGGVPAAPTFATSIIYIHDAAGNAFTLPPPATVANSVFTIRNLGTATTAITVLGGGKIDFVPSISGTSLTGHRLVNVADQIDLPVGDTVVVHAVSDGNPAPLQDSYYIISP
jgi:hypothetical protein